jgi:hypothetical protein
LVGCPSPAVLLNFDGNAEIMVVVEVAKFGDGDEFEGNALLGDEAESIFLHSPQALVAIHPFFPP